MDPVSGRNLATTEYNLCYLATSREGEDPRDRSCRVRGQSVPHHSVLTQLCARRPSKMPTDRVRVFTRTRAMATAVPLALLLLAHTLRVAADGGEQEPGAPTILAGLGHPRRSVRSQDGAGAGEPAPAPADCTCPPSPGTTRLRRAVPQTCRLCSGMLGTNATTGDLDIGAPPGGSVVVTAALVATHQLMLHAADVRLAVRAP